MAQKDIDTLKQEIDAAVHPGGGPPLIMGADLNTVLTSLATEVVGAGGPVRIADYYAICSAVENETFDTEEPAFHEFAVGDVVGQSGKGLFRCVQAFTLRYDLDVQFSSNHYPHNSPAYWSPIVRSSDGDGSSGDGKYVRLDDDTYKVARPGESSSAIVANPAWYHFTTGLGATVVGGNRNTAAATFGTVVGGQGNTLPEGAESSVILGGGGFTAPPRPDTVFAPKLVLWENGSTVELTDNNGSPHALAVNEAGGLLVDGQSVVPASAPSLSLFDSSYTTHTLTVNELGTLLVDGQSVLATPVPNLQMVDAGGRARNLTLDQAGTLRIDGQSVLPAFVPAITLLSASNNNIHTLTVNELGDLSVDGRPVTTPLLNYNLLTNGAVEADPATRRVPLGRVYQYDQPGNLPSPELRDGGVVVPVRGYYDISSRVSIAPTQMAVDESCGVSGGPEYTGLSMGWTDGSANARPLTAYSSQRMMLEAGTVVYLFAEFNKYAGHSIKVDGQLTVYLLRAA